MKNPEPNLGIKHVSIMTYCPYVHTVILSVVVLVTASLQKNEGDICPCVTPCNVTRYGKELSMVKIPSRGSARYLSRKYDKTEEYIRCVCACVFV